MTDKDIKIEIKAESAKASAEIKKLTKDIDKMNQRIQKGGSLNSRQVGQMTRSFQSLTAHVSKLALIYGSFHTLISGAVTTAKFEQSIKRLGVYSGATALELGKLEEEAKRLGETTVFSASQVADGMNEMALGGLSAQDQLAGIEDTLNLASVGMITLEEATNITVTAMKSFGLEATDMNNITDIIAKASTNSATTITQLGQALAKVGTVAKAYGVSLQETASALGVMADAGKRGAEAGTQLKIVMSRLAGNSEALKYINQLKDSTTGLAVSMYDAETGQLKSFEKQIEAITDGMKNLSELEKNIMLGKIVGEEGKASFIALANNMDEYKKKLEEIRKAMAENFASNSAKAMMDTLKGSFDELTSALNGLILKIGADLTPVFRELMDSATGAILALDADAVRDFAESIGFFLQVTGTLVSTVAKLGGVLIGLGSNYTNLLTVIVGTTVVMRQFASMGLLTATAGAGGLTKALRLLKIEMYALSKAMRTFIVTNPFVLLVAGIGGAVAVALDLYDNLEDRQKKFEEAMKSSEKTVAEVTEQIEKYYDNAKAKYVMSPAEQKAEIANLRASLEYLEKRREEVKKGNFTDGEKIALLQKLEDEQVKIIALSKQVSEAEDKKARAIEKATIAWEQQKEVSAKAHENYDKFIKTYDKLEAKAKKTLASIIKEQNKLNINIKKLEVERLGIIEEYGNKRIDLADEYASIEFDLSKKGLNDFKSYQADKQRIEELSNKAREALNTGNIEQASKYYSEIKSLASSFAGEEIKVNDAVLVNRKQTLEEGKKAYETARAGEEAILVEQEKRELEAHKLKLELIEIELEHNALSLELQLKMIEELATAKKEAGKDLYKFDGDDFLKEYKKKIADIFKKTGDQKAKIDLELGKDKFNAELKQVESKIDSLKSTGNKINIDSSQVEEASEKVDIFTGKIRESKNSIMSVEIDDLEEATEGWYSLEDAMVEGLSSEVKVDTEALQKAEDELNALKGWTDGEPIKVDVEVPAEKIDVAKTKLESLVYGDYKVKVDADTTPLDFGIRAKISEYKENVDGSKTLVMVANPEFTKMEKKLKAFRAKQKKIPLEQEVEVETKDIVKDVDKAKKVVETKPPAEIEVIADANPVVVEAERVTGIINSLNPILKIGVDASAPLAMIERLKLPTSSIHTIQEVRIPARASGGYIQKLASGGHFTGDGMVGGYDPTDSDSVTAKLTGGEYVVNRTATDHIGIGVLDAINGMKFDRPKGYADGGAVGDSGLVSRNISLNFMDDNGSAMGVDTDEATAQRIENYFRKYAQ